MVDFDGETLHVGLRPGQIVDWKESVVVDVHRELRWHGFTIDEAMPFASRISVNGDKAWAAAFKADSLPDGLYVEEAEVVLLADLDQPPAFSRVERFFQVRGGVVTRLTRSQYSDAVLRPRIEPDGFGGMHVVIDGGVRKSPNRTTPRDASAVQDIAIFVNTVPNHPEREER